MATIDEKNIRKIAHLAQLELAGDNIPMYTKHLRNVLEFISPINQVDTEKVNPMYQVFDFALRLRPDQVTETNQKKLLQSNASCIENDFYMVPKVIEMCEIET